MTFAFANNEADVPNSVYQAEFLAIKKAIH